MGRFKQNIAFGILYGTLTYLYGRCIKLQYDLAISRLATEFYKEAYEDAKDKLSDGKTTKWGIKKNKEEA